MLLARQFCSAVKLSPDASKLAYEIVDSSQQPAGYKLPDGPSGCGDVPSAPTGIGLVNALNGAMLATAKVDSGLGIGDFVWTQDSQQVLFTAGHYNQTYYPVTPSLYALNTVTLQIAPGPMLTTDPGVFVALLACSNALFYTTQPLQGDRMTLYSTSFANLGTHTPLTSAAQLGFVGCVPG